MAAVISAPKNVYELPDKDRGRVRELLTRRPDGKKLYKKGRVQLDLCRQGQMSDPLSPFEKKVLN